MSAFENVSFSLSLLGYLWGSMVRNPRFRRVRFRFWGEPAISKSVVRGKWVRHNLVLRSVVCWKVVNVLVGGVYVPSNTDVSPDTVLKGEPVLARVITTNPTPNVTLGRFEVLKRLDTADYDVFVIPVRNTVVNNGNKCIEKIKVDDIREVIRFQPIMLRPHKGIQVAIITLPTGRKVKVRFENMLSRVIISRDEYEI